MIQESHKGVHRVEGLGDEVLAVFSGREFNASNRKDYLKEINILPENLVLLNQVHSANLVLVSNDKKPSPDCKADGMLSTTPGIALGIFTADCVPIYFWDPQHRIIGIAHAGWRGVYHGIARKMVQAYRQNFLSEPSAIKIAIGPAIRKCCYEVGAEFADFFPEYYKPPRKLKGLAVGGRMDLVAAIQADLTSEGIAPENVVDTGVCTACCQDRFFSFRKEKTAERILSIICIKPQN